MPYLRANSVADTPASYSFKTFKICISLNRFIFTVITSWLLIYQKTLVAAGGILGGGTQRLATDCLVSVPTVQQYLSILENTYTVSKITPYVGNKRKEITSNPMYYFLDNGFRNQSLHNLSLELDVRQDLGLLIQSAVFQEIMKFKVQHFYDFEIHFWRTQSGAEVDFVLYKNEGCIIPVEVKYRTMNKPTVSRSFRSYIDAYQPKHGFLITKDYNKIIMIHDCEVHFISLPRLLTFLEILKKLLQ